MRQLHIFKNCNAHLVRDIPVICGNIAKFEDTLIIYCNMKRYIDWADRLVPEYFDHVESSPLLGVYGCRSGRDLYRAIPALVLEGSLSCHTCFDMGLRITRDLIRRTAPTVQSPLTTSKGDWGSVLARAPNGRYRWVKNLDMDYQ